MVTNVDRLPSRPHPNKVNTTGAISWATNGGYESPNSDDGVGPTTPMRSAPNTFACPSREGRHDARTPSEMERGLSNMRAASLNDLVLKAKAARGQISIKDRIACIQWNWFTMTMATGGIANVLASIPYKTRWLDIVGLVFFFFNLVLFLTICTMIGFRFHYRPGSFISTFTDQVESLFIPATVVSIATILITVCEYGIPNTRPWLLHVMEILFWIYIAFATIASAGIYLILWSSLTFPIHTMTPTWVFPAYPMLLTAPFGGSLINAAIQRNELHHLSGPAIMFASVTVQGAGFLIAFMICSAFIYRLMTQKLPRDAQRPGVFISIGPFGFTVAGILNLGNKAELILPDGFLSIPNSVSILKILSTMVGLWLWGLCIWFFLVSVGSLWKYIFPNHRLPFQVTWFSFVFPNTALVTATFQLGDALDSRPLKVLGCVLAAALVAVWLLVFAGLVRGFWRRELLWPKDED